MNAQLEELLDKANFVKVFIDEDKVYNLEVLPMNATSGHLRYYTGDSLTQCVLDALQDMGYMEYE